MLKDVDDHRLQVQVKKLKIFHHYLSLARRTLQRDLKNHLMHSELSRCAVQWTKGGEGGL